MKDYLLKRAITEEFLGLQICESVEDNNIVNELYNAFTQDIIFKPLFEKLLVGEPVSVPELRKLLRKKILNFKFIKLDGEVRPARGTTMMKYIPKSDHPKGIRPSSPKVATFFDLDKKAWRSVSNKSKEIVLNYAFGEKGEKKPVFVVKDVEEKPEKKPEVKPDVKKVEKDGDIVVKDVEAVEEPEVEVKDVDVIEEPSFDDIDDVGVKDVEPIEVDPEDEFSILDIEPIEKKPKEKPKPEQEPESKIEPEPKPELKSKPKKYGFTKKPLPKPKFKAKPKETTVLLPKKVEEKPDIPEEDIEPAKNEPLNIEPEEGV